MPNYSVFAAILTQLLKKNIQWCWKEEHEKAFQELKSILISAPLLQYQNFKKLFILTTDASEYAIGAILSQGQEKNDLPIAYASRILNDTERNYSVIEKEALAIVWACKHFRPYLIGSHFNIYTDQRSLT